MDDDDDLHQLIIIRREMRGIYEIDVRDALLECGHLWA